MDTYFGECHGTGGVHDTSFCCASVSTAFELGYKRVPYNNVLQGCVALLGGCFLLYQLVRRAPRFAGRASRAAERDAPSAAHRPSAAAVRRQFMRRRRYSRDASAQPLVSRCAPTPPPFARRSLFVA